MYSNNEKDYEEIFESPYQKETKGDALKTLQAIRDAHPASSGWVEIKGFVEQLPNGKWRAVRHHKKVRKTA